MHAASLDLTQEPSLQCPVCRAQQPLADVCRRCKADLTLLRREAEAELDCKRRCLDLLGRGQPAAALPYARRLHSLRRDSQSARLLAVCCLHCGEYGAALALAERWRG